MKNWFFKNWIWVVTAVVIIVVVIWKWSTIKGWMSNTMASFKKPAAAPAASAPAAK
jgi:predicted negative regulator of RcsB-dependent stress response